MSLLKNKFDLTKKVALITGGLGLLGKKHTEAIAELGGTVILLDINDNGATDFCEKITNEYKTGCTFYKCNITNEDELVKIKNEITNTSKAVDILINNAAIDPKVEKSSNINLSRLENFQLEQWEKEIAVGLTGAMLCTKIFGSEMARNGRGVIINISSDLGIIAPDQRLYKVEGIEDGFQNVKPVTYSVIKHGLIGLTKYISTYWADKGVRANTLCPAGVYNNQPEEFVSKIRNLIPMGKMADVNDYKGAIAFLASEASSYMNGATLIIDGGRSIL